MPKNRGSHGSQVCRSLHVKKHGTSSLLAQLASLPFHKAPQELYGMFPYSQMFVSLPFQLISTRD